MNKYKFTLFWCLGMAFIWQFSCTPQNQQNQTTMIPISVIDEASNEWINLDGVEGIAEGDWEGKPCIMVLTSKDSSQIAALIPKSFKGYPVIIEYSGKIKTY